MPSDSDDVLDLDPGAVDRSEIGDSEMAEPSQANMEVVSTALAQGFAAAHQRRTDAADQLASDSQRMWSIAMTSPTVSSALGFRPATEAGSGRTRVEANTPASGQVTGAS